MWSIACQSLWPCPLVEEVSFLEVMKRRKKRSRAGETDNLEIAAALPLAVTVLAGKVDEKRKGGTAAPSAPKWEPFEGWDMRPIAAPPPSAAAPAISNVSGGVAAATEAEEIGLREGDEKSTRDVIIDL